MKSYHFTSQLSDEEMLSDRAIGTFLEQLPITVQDDDAESFQQPDVVSICTSFFSGQSGNLIELDNPP